MKTIWFKHPNTGTEVAVDANQIFGIQYLPNNKLTVVVGPGGSMIPVEGTVREVEERIQNLDKEQETINDPVTKEEI